MKVCLVTGANRGIGLALVAKLASLCKPGDGKMVIACSRSGSAELEEILKNPAVHHVKLDITSEESVNSAYENVQGILQGKGINLIVNNAAVAKRSENALKTSCEDMLENFNVNVVGTHRVTMKFAPLLVLAAEQNPEADVGCDRAFCLNVSSAVGSMANTTSSSNAAYRISKAALNMLTRVTCFDLMEKHVLCCSVHPGWVQTDMGGANALIPVSSCVNDLMEVITKANKDHAGVMLRNKMEVMPY